MSGLAISKHLENQIAATSTHLKCESVRQGHEPLAGHVQNGVCGGLLFYQPDGLTGR
jgi:hypothetical protein